MTAKRLICLGAALALALTFNAALAATSSLEDRVAEKRFDNGMTVFVLKRPGAPVVSLQMAFRAGAVDEPSGRTGMAHLLEHLLFKGTRTLGTSDWAAEEPLLAEIEKAGRELDALKRGGASEEKVSAASARLVELSQRAGKYVVKGEIDGLYSRNGGVGLNASTSADMTNYYVSLPSNRLELWAAIESERMRDPVLREYYTERAVVAEERRERSETQPGGMLFQALLSAAFSAHPYRNPVIGWPSDLDYLDIEPTREFYRTHYGPDNSVVVAVGDVEPEPFFGLIERYFGDIPARGTATIPPTVEPPQAGPRAVTVYFDAQPRGVLAYHKPSLPHRDDYVMDVADGVLSSGDSSRLVRELVYKRKILNSVGTSNGFPGARYPNLFVVSFTPAESVTLEEAAQAVRDELKKLATTPPDRTELDRVLAGLEADMVRGLIQDAGLAQRLAFYQTVAGDWRYIERLPKVLAGVTPQEVADAAARYFTPENETFAVLKSKASK